MVYGFLAVVAHLPLNGEAAGTVGLRVLLAIFWHINPKCMWTKCWQHGLTYPPPSLQKNHLPGFVILEETGWNRAKYFRLPSKNYSEGPLYILLAYGKRREVKEGKDTELWMRSLALCICHSLTQGTQPVSFGVFICNLAAEFGWIDTWVFNNEVDGGIPASPPETCFASLCTFGSIHESEPSEDPLLSCPQGWISCQSWAVLRPAWCLFMIHPIIVGPRTTESDSGNGIQPHWSSQGFRFLI